MLVTYCRVVVYQLLAMECILKVAPVSKHSMHVLKEIVTYLQRTLESNDADEDDQLSLLPQSMLLVLLSAVKNSTQHRNYLISNFDLTELCIRFVVQKHECVL